MPSSSPPHAAGGSGKWVVVAIVLIGVILGLFAMKFRIHPPAKPTTVPSTVPIAQDAVNERPQR